MGSLTDRQFQTIRQVRPGRKTKDRIDPEADKPQPKHPEEYAVAVADADGNPIIGKLPALIELLVGELRRTNKLLEVLTGEEIDLSEVL